MPRHFAPCANSVERWLARSRVESHLGCLSASRRWTPCFPVVAWNGDRLSSGCRPSRGAVWRRSRCKACAVLSNNTGSGRLSIPRASSILPPLAAGASCWSLCCCSDRPAAGVLVCRPVVAGAVVVRRRDHHDSLASAVSSAATVPLATAAGHRSVLTRGLADSRRPLGRCASQRSRADRVGLVARSGSSTSTPGNGFVRSPEELLPSSPTASCKASTVSAICWWIASTI